MPAMTLKSGSRAGLRLCTAICFLLMALSIASAELRVGQRLADALGELNRDGASLLFSSEIVNDDMRILEVPRSGTLMERARAILAPHGLAVQQGPGDRWLVVPTNEAPGRNDAGAPNSSAGASSEARMSTLDEVLVMASRYRMYGDDTASDLRHDEIDRLPHLADDLMRAIARLPAANSDDFSARIRLRGGAREETGVYLDGLKLIDPFHLKDLAGALSIVDSNLIERVDVLPGGFPARYGDAASGVITVQTLAPPDETVHSVGVSFVNAFANTRGSFESGRGGWLLSLRRGYLDWLFQLVDTGSGEFTPRYGDVMARIEHDIGDRHVISGHVLAAEDDLKYFDDGEDTTVDGDAQTVFLWSRLQSFWSDAVSTEFVIWRSTLDRTRSARVNDSDTITADVVDRRDIQSTGLRLDGRWLLRNDWSAGFGVEVTENQVEYDYFLNAVSNNPAFPGELPVIRQTSLPVDGGTIHYYGSVRKQLRNLGIELGWRVDEEDYTELAQAVSGPRLNVRYDLSPRSSLLFAWGDYNQFQPIEALQVEDGVTRFFPATEAEYRSIGFEQDFDGLLDLRIDLYEKRYRRLRPRFVNLLDSYEPIPEANPDRTRIDANAAKARGLEISLQQKAAKGFSWWASYTYASVEDAIDGTDIVREWDQPHSFNALLNWQGVRWNVSVAAAWRTGWPRTQPTLQVSGSPPAQDPEIVLGPRNASRYSDYARVDARISREVRLQRGSFTYFLEIYNLLDAANTCCVDEMAVLPGPTLQLSEETWLPRMPSFGFTWIF